MCGVPDNVTDVKICWPEQHMKLHAILPIVQVMNQLIYSWHTHFTEWPIFKYIVLHWRWLTDCRGYRIITYSRYYHLLIALQHFKRVCDQWGFILMMSHYHNWPVVTEGPFPNVKLNMTKQKLTCQTRSPLLPFHFVDFPSFHHLEFGHTRPQNSHSLYCRCHGWSKSSTEGWWRWL